MQPRSGSPRQKSLTPHFTRDNSTQQKPSNGFTYRRSLLISGGQLFSFCSSSPKAGQQKLAASCSGTLKPALRAQLVPAGRTEVVVNSGPSISLLFFYYTPKLSKTFSLSCHRSPVLSSTATPLFTGKGMLMRAVMSRCGSGDAHSDLRK